MTRHKPASKPRPNRSLPRCYRCGQAIRDNEYLNERGHPAHLNACPPPKFDPKLDQ